VTKIMKKRDWSTGPIEVEDKTWNMSIKVVPGDMYWIIDDVIDEAIAIAGGHPSTTDLPKARAIVYTLFRNQVMAYFATAGIEGAKEDLEAIFGRDDFKEDMPWIYLINHEAVGVAAYNLVAKQLREDWPETRSILIKAGEADPA